MIENWIPFVFSYSTEQFVTHIEVLVYLFVIAMFIAAIASLFRG